MSSLPEIDVVVLQYGSPEITAGFFASAKKSNAPIRIIFVDNGSTKDENQVALKALKDTGLPFIDVHLPVNEGFPCAANKGLSMSTAPYVVMQGNDTEVFPGCFEKMRKALVGEKKPSLVGPITSSCDTPQNINKMPGSGLNAEHTRLKRSGIYKASHERRAQIAADVMAGEIRRLKKYLAFFCVMIPRVTLDVIGLLDPAYSPGFGEDNDYCHRVVKGGGSLLVAMDVYVRHIHRATFSKTMESKAIKALSRRNQGIFFRKWGCYP